MIICKSCQFENDDTRVFCQNCGGRLEVEGREVEAAEPKRSVASRPRSQPAAPRQWPKFLVICLGLLREIFWTAVLAAILATLIQAVRPPDNLPAPVDPRPTTASLLAADIQSAIESNYPRSVEVDEASANNFLTTRVTGGEGGFLQARLARTYLSFRDGSAALGVEQRVGGHPVYLQLVIDPVPASPGTTAHIVSGSIGRVPVPSFLLPFFQRSFQPVLLSLSHPISWLSKASAVEITPGLATLRWAGKTP